MTASSDSHWIPAQQQAELSARGKFLAGNPGIAIAFLWGFAEGTLFFVVPDVFLSLAAIFSPRRVWRHILAATLGAVLAGALLYTWSLKNPVEARTTVERVPFVSQKMFSSVEKGYQKQGIAAVFLGPLSGIPYKIYAIEAPKYFRLAAFASATAPARAWRFVLVSYVSALLAAWFRKIWHLSEQKLVAIHAVCWIVFYAFYWTRIALA